MNIQQRSDKQDQIVTQLEDMGWQVSTEDDDTVFMHRRHPRRRYSTIMCQVERDGTINGVDPYDEEFR